MNEAIVIIIPAFNAGSKLQQIIDTLQQSHPELPIVLVDDGTTDRSIEALSPSKKLILLRHASNRGKGAALKTGIEYVIRTMPEAEAVLFMDADGQHAPKHIKAFISAHKHGRGTFIIGKRALSLKYMPFARLLSNRITSFLLSKKLGIKIHDSQCGFRMISTDVLRRCPPLRTNGYELETELLIKAARASARFAFVEIDTVYGGETSHIRGLRDTLAFIRVFLTVR